MKDRFVVLKTYPDPISANVDRTLLEYNDIEVIIENEATSTTLSSMMGGISEVRLKVSTSNLDNAKEILEENGYKYSTFSNKRRVINLFIILLIVPPVIPLIPILYILNRNLFKGSEIIPLICFVISVLTFIFIVLS